MLLTCVVLILLIIFFTKAWRYYLESSEDLRHLHLLEPWYWFVFLNLVLVPISSNFDYQYVWLGLIIQIALSVWFAVSVGWIIESCPHPSAIVHQSQFVKGKGIKFCYRCGSRLSEESTPSLVESHAWQVTLFQLPPSLLEYVSFWVAQSVMVLIALFLTLKFLKHPELQHTAVLLAVVAIIFVPPLVYFLGRFRRYLTDNKGMIWWDDLKSSFLTWGLVVLVLWGVIHFLPG